MLKALIFLTQKLQCLILTWFLVVPAMISYNRFLVMIIELNLIVLYSDLLLSEEPLVSNNVDVKNKNIFNFNTLCKS